MGIPFTGGMGFLFTMTMGKLFTMTLGIQLTVSSAPSEEVATVAKESAQVLQARAAAGTDAKTQTLSAIDSGGSFYIYSYDGRLLAEYNRQDQPVKDYIYIGNRLLAEYKPQEEETYFYTPDQINSTRIVTGQSGTVVYSAAHDPYGGMQKTWVNAYDPTPKFSGKERDAESELDYFGARYYDRSQYRFISADPVVNINASVKNPQRWHLFSYCMNNPTSFVDPDGEDLVPFSLPAAGGKTLFTYVDSAFASKLSGFIGLCNELGVNVTFNNAYRTQAEQDYLRTSNSKATGLSLHSVGWAVDLNWSLLTPYEQGLVELAAICLDLRSGTAFNDAGHYDQFAPNWNNGSIVVQSLERVELIYQAYEQFFSFKLFELDPMGLYMLFGVFTISAAENVMMKAIDSAINDIKK